MSSILPEPGETAAELEWLRMFAGAALERLERARGRIDALDVYPIPDGDTGTNMALTVKALVEDLDALDSLTCKLPRREAARALVMGARGTSGVILSQLVRAVLEAAPAGLEIDAKALATMLERANSSARAAVNKPLEGTMLSLASELAEQARAGAKAKQPLAALLPALVECAERALARTPEQLSVLREACVVDAGATGLLECLRAVAGVIAAEPLPGRPELQLVPEAGESRAGSPGYLYSASFTISGKGLDAALIRAQLAGVGELLFFGAASRAIKVQLNTNDPGTALEVACTAGTLDAVEITRQRL